jgi:AAA domain
MGEYLAPTFDEIEPDDQHWLWKGYIPESLLTVTIAAPGDGKSNVAYDIAARVSQGREMPDGSDGGEAGYVVLCAVEDDARTSVWLKLDAAGADKAHVINASDGPDGDGWQLDLDGVAWLREVVKERPGVRLIIVDTLTATATKSITSPQSLKVQLRWLVGLARDTGAAVWLQCHQRKDGRAAGGYTLLSTVRQALEIERSPYGPERTLKVLKSNVMPDTGNEGLTFTITGSAPRTRIEWAWNVRKIGSGSSSTEQVLTVLRLAGQPVTAQFVVARTGLKYPHVRVILGRLIRRGEVRSAGRNAYTAAEPAGSTAESASA